MRYTLAFSVIEVLLSVSIVGLLVTALVGASIYGFQSSQLAEQRARAVFLAEEGLEAVRNIRDGGFNDLAVGTHGLAISSNKWAFSGSQDTTDIFSRQIDIANVDSKRKTVTSTVTWQQTLPSTRSVQLMARFTNWLQTVSNWANPEQEASLDLSGGADGVKIQVQGNYVYIIRSGGVDFAVIDINTPASPALVGSLTLTGTPQNIFVAGNYAYISSEDNSQELQIIDISTPSSPSVVGTFNSAGNANALGVYVSGTTAYLVRASSSDDEFIEVNISTPSSPSLIGTLNLSADGNEVVVLGSKAYVASASNSQELQVVDIATPATPAVVGSYDISGNTDAITIAGLGTTVFLGHGSDIFLLDVSTPTSPTLISTFAGAGSVNDIALNFGSSDTYVYFVTANSNKEFELFDISTPATPLSVGSLNLTSFSGIAYDSVHDRAFLVGPGDASELVVIKPQ